MSKIILLFFYHWILFLFYILRKAIINQAEDGGISFLRLSVQRQFHDQQLFSSRAVSQCIRISAGFH
jgi:hypothetical protein